MSDCRKCPHEHTRCTAHNRAGNPCGMRPQPGLTVCHLHGGKTRAAQAAGRRRVELAKAQATFGLPRDVAPDVALLEEVHRTAGHVAWLGQQVAELDPTQATWTHVEDRHKTGGDDWGDTTTHRAQPSIWYELYQRERKHLIDVCKAALAAGVEERRVRLAESQGELLAGAIKKILADLHLTDEQQRLVPTIVPRHLKAVAG